MPHVHSASSAPNVALVRRFYAALLDEVEQAGYDAAERELLAHPHHYYGRYLNPRTRAYVTLAVMPRIADAISYFDLAHQPGRRVLDLGCGLGMQSLIFARLGARVVGVDVREESVLLCRKRKAYYESKLGEKLDLEFRLGNFAASDDVDFGPRFDALFSMAAFSYIKPLDATVRRASAILADDASVFLYEENATYLLDHLKRSEPIPSPKTVVRAFAREGFDVDFLRGAGAVPNSLWRWAALNERLMRPANEALRRLLPLSFSYVLGMTRAPASTGSR